MALIKPVLLPARIEVYPLANDYVRFTESLTQKERQAVEEIKARLMPLDTESVVRVLCYVSAQNLGEGTHGRL